MSINFTSVTVTNGSANVTINTSIDLTAIQYGWELQVIGAPLMLSIASGGQNEITLQQPYTATGTLTNVAAKIIETKAALAAALDNVTLFGNQMIATKNTNQAIIDALGSAANADVTTSNTDANNNRVMTVGYSGLGKPGPTVVNVLAALVNGMYSGFGTNGLNYPSGLKFGNFLNMVRDNNTNVHTRLYLGPKNDTVEAYFSSSNDGGNTFVDEEAFHSGNSVNPLAYGIGNVGQDGINNGRLSDTIDFSDLPKVSMGISWDTSSAPPPSAADIRASAGFRFASKASRYSDFLIQNQDANGDIPLKVVFKSYDGLNESDWFEFYHSGNTNFNVFGGLVSNDILALGIADDSTSGRFMLPINSLTAPTSVTIAAGSVFDVQRGDNTIDTDATLSISSTSSNKLLVLLFSGVTGLSSGESLYLKASNGSSKITVNF
jgi:hypothetical protein